MSYESDCATESYIRPHDDHYNHLDNYAELLKRWHFFFGSLKSAELIFIVGYIMRCYVRGIRLSFFQLSCLTVLGCVCFLDIVVDFNFFGIGDDEYAKSCFYLRRVFDGTSLLLLYCLTTLIVFRLYNFTHMVYEFAKNGNLPTEQSLKRSQYIMIGIWVSSTILVF